MFRLIVQARHLHGPSKYHTHLINYRLSCSISVAGTRRISDQDGRLNGHASGDSWQRILMSAYSERKALKEGCVTRTSPTSGGQGFVKRLQLVTVVGTWQRDLRLANSRVSQDRIAAFYNTATSITSHCTFKDRKALHSRLHHCAGLVKIYFAMTTKQLRL